MKEADRQEFRLLFVFSAVVYLLGLVIGFLAGKGIIL